MKKLTLWQAHLINDGLKLAKQEWKHEIRKTIRKGKTPLMTEQFVDQQIEEILDKIKGLTLKTKK